MFNPGDPVRPNNLSDRRTITPPRDDSSAGARPIARGIAPPLAAAVRVARKQQDVALPLVLSLGMEMVDIVVQRPPQRALAKQDHLRQALLPDRSDPALRVGIQVRAARWQRQRLNPT